jgi:hypothetical protein
VRSSEWSFDCNVHLINLIQGRERVNNIDASKQVWAFLRGSYTVRETSWRLKLLQEWKRNQWVSVDLQLLKPWNFICFWKFQIQSSRYLLASDFSLWEGKSCPSFFQPDKLQLVPICECITGLTWNWLCNSDVNITFALEIITHNCAQGWVTTAHILRTTLAVA